MYETIDTMTGIKVAIIGSLLGFLGTFLQVEPTPLAEILAEILRQSPIAGVMFFIWWSGRKDLKEQHKEHEQNYSELMSRVLDILEKIDVNGK